MREFAADERGMAMIMVSIMLPVLIGFALLAIDMSRANNLHNDLQKGADAFALAAAAELDGASDSWTRAERALANMVDNTTRFSEDGPSTLASGGSVAIDGTYNACRSRGDISWCFLKSIPALDSTLLNVNGSDALGVNHRAANTAETRFIQVQIDPAAAGVFAAIFPASFLTGDTDDNGFNIGAQAVAGFGSAVCDFTPVFICNPYEDPADVGGVDLRQAVAERQYRRRLIELRSVGGGAAFFPGNFGFLDSEGSNGARGLAEMIASSQPRNCYSSDGVDTKTGQNSGPVKAAFNLRFGIQEPGSGSWNSAEYGPAQNVRKGAYRPSGNQNQCPSSNQLTFGDPNQALAPDPCFSTETCTLMDGRMGNGDWNFQKYWDSVHPGTPLKEGWSYSGANQPTRYEVYRYEIEHNGGALLAHQATYGGVTGTERGTPPSGCGAPVTAVDRRLIYGAILNCMELEAQGYDLGGHDEDLPVEAFASFFISEPVKKIPHSEYDASVLVELVDITGIYGRGTLEDFQRDEAQLYR